MFFLKSVSYVVFLVSIVLFVKYFLITEPAYEQKVIKESIVENSLPQKQVTSTYEVKTSTTSSEVVKINNTTSSDTDIRSTTKPLFKDPERELPKTTTNKPVDTVKNQPTKEPLTIKKTDYTIATTTKKKVKPLSWGVYPGPTPESVTLFEENVSRNPDYIAHFVHWGNGEGELPSWLKDYAYKKDRTLIIFWEASDYLVGGTEQPDFSFRNILHGQHDQYISNFANQIKSYKGSVILVPFSELNGNWNPWSGTTNGNTPGEAVQAFRYVHGFFDDVPNVKFGLAVNAASVPNTYENRIEAYYPGDAYVDYIGVDGFNTGNPWNSFSEIFNSPLTILGQYNKPIFIFSFASAEGADKAGWLDDTLNVQMPKYPLLKGFIYFNQNKERNWLLWSDQKTLSVFNDYVSR